MKTITEVQDFLGPFVRWASNQPDVHGVALVGSFARGEARADSDLDLVILTDQPETYLHSMQWAEQFGKMAKHQIEDYGKLTSLRIWYQDGLDVEYGITMAGSPVFEFAVAAVIG